MKTTITITGHIMGNYKLRNAIVTAQSTERAVMFNGIQLTFQTKKAAVKALSDAYKSFCREMPEEKKTGNDR